MFRMMVIGASGQVGQEFRKCLPADRFVPLDHSQIEVADSSSVSSALARVTASTGSPAPVVVNLAAFHNVNECEDQGARAFSVNASGAHVVAQAAHSIGARVVFLSSDYVFGLDENRRTPYVERDPVGPLNVYGVSKVAGEHLVRSVSPNHLIVRASSLFGAVTSRKGWTFPEMILRRAQAGESLRVVNDQFMSPTYTRDLVRTIEALLKAGATGTVHVANSGVCSWYEFAQATLETAGINHPVEPVSSEAFPSRARRPRYSSIASERLASIGVEPMRPWRDALRAYLMEKGAIVG